VAETIKVLGQVAPDADTLTALYTVPSLKAATVSTISICNQNLGLKAEICVSVAVGGANDEPKQYVFYDLEIVAKDTVLATIGMTLAAGDIVRVCASSENVSFNLFGVELDV
jgi:hypothetical protein